MQCTTLTKETQLPSGAVRHLEFFK